MNRFDKTDRWISSDDGFRNESILVEATQALFQRCENIHLRIWLSTVSPDPNDWLHREFVWNSQNGCCGFQASDGNGRLCINVTLVVWPCGKIFYGSHLTGPETTMVTFITVFIRIDKNVLEIDLSLVGHPNIDLCCAFPTMGDRSTIESLFWPVVLVDFVLFAIASCLNGSGSTWPIKWPFFDDPKLFMALTKAKLTLIFFVRFLNVWAFGGEKIEINSHLMMFAQSWENFVIFSSVWRVVRFRFRFWFRALFPWIFNVNSI